MLFFLPFVFASVTPGDTLAPAVQPLWHALPEAEVASIGVTAGATSADEVPGCLHVLTPAELQRFAYTDPLRTLRTVPGMQLVEEDGFGLRPNIGIRGSGSDRSSRIAVLEDGIPIAPAAYTAPAAYYFPSVARMSRIEVLKGSSQIAFGPVTAGGAINLVSTPAPDSGTVARIHTEGGSYGFQLLHAVAGTAIPTRAGVLSVLAEVLDAGSDGFKELDGGGPTGFRKTDRMLKVQWYAPARAALNQSLALKLADVAEVSHETYLGLSEADFAAAPLRRYFGTRLDRMDARQTQAVLTHRISAGGWELLTDAYRTRFDREWYKLDRVREAGGEVVGLADAVGSPDEHALAYALLTGDASAATGAAALELRNNDRGYYASGIQHRAVRTFAAFGSSQQRITVGVRYHRDGADRLDYRDGYVPRDGELVRTTAGTPGSAGNREEGASAVATYVRGAVHTGRWTWTPGVRWETIAFERTDFTADDPARTDGTTTQRHVRALLPGLGVSYAVRDGLDAFAGVHRGFVPPGTSPDALPERNLQSEAGFRTVSRWTSAQVVAFHCSYDKLLGADLTALGGSGSGDAFNGGSAYAGGIEFEAVVDLLGRFSGPGRSDELPLQLTYTWTDARFTESFVSTFEPWGTVEAGDRMPYVSPHTASAVIGWQRANWAVDASFRYAAPMGSGDGFTVADAGVRWEFKPGCELRIQGTNLTDSQAVASFRPYGARPLAPRMLRWGVSFAL
jgi:Fe(3+) dicitrate transport protein